MDKKSLNLLAQVLKIPLNKINPKEGVGIPFKIYFEYRQIFFRNLLVKFSNY